MDVEKVIEAGARAAWAKKTGYRLDDWELLNDAARVQQRIMARACLTAALAEARAQGAVLVMVPGERGLSSAMRPLELARTDAYNAAIAAIRASEVGL